MRITINSIIQCPQLHRKSDPIMNLFAVELEKPTDGWLQCKLFDDNSVIEFCASHTPRDTFDDLVRSVRALYEFESPQLVEIYEEPEVWQLSLEKEQDYLVIELLDNTGKLDRKLKCNFQSGCKEFAAKFELLLQEMGVDEFTSAWGHAPPIEQIDALRRLLLRSYE